MILSIIEIIKNFYHIQNLMSYIYFNRYGFKNIFSEQVLKSPLHNIKEYDSGDLVSRINNDMSRRIGMVKSIPNIICQPILFILAFIYGISINIKLFLACTVIIPILSFSFNKISRSAKKYGKELTESMSDANSLFKDMINGIYVLKSYNLGHIFSKKYKEKLIKSGKNQLELYKISALLGICNNIIWIIPYIICPIEVVFSCFSNL